MNLKDKIKESSVETLNSLNQNKKAFFLVVVLALIFMFALCWIVFFITVRGPEQVMVPNVEGKELTTALLELQAKELYPKIQLKYTDNPDDAGKILNQNPESGAIVKAGRRINLTVSRLMASFLPEGGVSYLYYAQRMFEFPQGIFIVSLAQAALLFLVVVVRWHGMFSLREGERVVKISRPGTSGNRSRCNRAALRSSRFRLPKPCTVRFSSCRGRRTSRSAGTGWKSCISSFRSRIASGSPASSCRGPPSAGAGFRPSRRRG